MHVRTAVLLALGALTLIGASRPLNPLVPRVPNANAAVDPECAEGTAPAPPRIEVSEIPLPEPEPNLQAPPSTGLRTMLRDAQTALVRDDRSSFDAALVRIRTMLADYPAGAERTSAQNVLRVFEDAGVLWDAQFLSPFFGEESSAYRVASAYPGWAEAIRRQVLVDDRDRRFYPARESRQFLASVAAQRLDRLGVRTPAVAVQRPRVVEDDPATALPSVTPRRRPGKVETHASTPARRRSTTSRSVSTAPPRRSISSPAPSNAAPAPSNASPAPSNASPAPSNTTPAPSNTTPAPSNVSPAPSNASPTQSIAPPDQSTSSPTQSPGETPPPPAPAADDPPATTDTTPTSTLATDTTATTTAAGGAPARGRNLVLPLILILVGIGVLILLFRASN